MWPRATSSIESAITSRLTSEVFIPSVPIVMPSEIATVLNSIGVPPAARTPVLDLLGEAAQVEVARHRLGPGVGDADDRPLQRVVVEADALQVRARRRPVRAVEDDPAAAAEVAAHRGGGPRASAGRRWPSCGAARRRSHSASRQRSRRTRAGSSWRPTRCMLARRITRSSSEVSAIHLASTSSEAGRRWRPPLAGQVGELDAVLAQQPAAAGDVGDDRLVRVDQVGVGGAGAGAVGVAARCLPTTRMKPRSRYIAHSSALTQERSSSRARCSARRSRPGS